MKESWDDCGADTKSWMIAYNQVRDYEEAEDAMQMAKISMMSRM